MQRGENGFTLIELLIVVAIVGIIAAVVIPNVVGFRTSGQLVAANEELGNVKTAALAYHANNSAWPSSSSQLTAFLAGNLTGYYEFDASYGWVINGTSWSGLNWQAGTTGVKGTHGKWVRP
jgi:prepilin-type N-terminal cleavage/methylation domain-containing protein